jgi:fatty-acyl-CoA synthase
VANGLIGLGVTPETRICYLGKNSDYFFEIFFGAIQAAAVLVPLNWRLAIPEIIAIVRDAEATVLFVGPGFETQAASLNAAGLRLFSIDAASSAWRDYAEWRDALPDQDPKVAIAPGDTYVQLYTSGTTGLPKGVELTHRNCL